AEHYENVLGLVRSATGADGRVYLKAWDEHDHHSVILRQADAPGMDAMGFKVADAGTLAALEGRLREHGVKPERMPAGSDIGTGERVRFTTPTGHVIELYAAAERVGNGLALENPEVWPDGLKGIHPTHFDHCLLYGDEIDATVALFTDVLGFRMAERVVSA